MSKKHLKTIFLAVLFMFLASAGYIFAASLDNPENSEISQTKTYTDENTDITFSYPSELVIFQSRENFVQFTAPGFVNIEGEIPSIMVIVRDNPNRIEVENWFAQNSNLYIGDRNFNEVGHSGILVLEKSDQQLAEVIFQGLGELKTTVISHGDQIIEFTAHSVVGFEKDEKLLADYNSIIDSYIEN